jgi:beta-glucanase (GH16 family)
MCVKPTHCVIGGMLQQTYTPENVRVRNGKLVIEGRYESTGQLTSGKVRTQGKYHIAPSTKYPTIKIEASMKLPQGGWRVIPGIRCTHPFHPHSYHTNTLGTGSTVALPPGAVRCPAPLGAQQQCWLPSLAAGLGLWPAFWMLPRDRKSAQWCSGCGDYGGWPASGEIDILEAKNSMQFVSAM